MNIERIAAYAKTREIIEKHNVRVKKNFGQNFLVDAHVMNKIIAAASITAEDLVIEIGPGIGGLTQILAESAGKVVAVEIDRELIPVLADSLQSYDNVEIINKDIMKTDIAAVIKDSGYTKAKIVANLPYYISTPIIMNILEEKLPVETITVMVQKEVGDRMKAQPSTKDYGALTLAVGYYSNVALVANVPRNSFIPRPNVDSAVIQLEILPEPPVNVRDDAFMFKIIKAAFGQRRKTLVNCIYNQCGLELSKEQLEVILDLCGLNPNVRGEALSLNQFAMIADCILQ